MTPLRLPEEGGEMVRETEVGVREEMVTLEGEPLGTAGERGKQCVCVCVCQ